MGEVVLINGRVFEPGEARVSVFDHGFLFGDSVYEVVRTRGGRLFQFEPHAARLERSAAQIYMELPFTQRELEEELERALELAGNAESYARIVVTRGVGELELHPGTCGRPTLLIIVKALGRPPARLYRDGIRLAIVGRRRMDPLSLSPTAKTGNYLNNVLAMIEARRRDADDAVMLNAEGFLTEGTTSNVFFVKDGVVRTPETGSGILEGITRGLVIRMLGEMGYEVEEGEFPARSLREADEVFITSSTRDVMPVRQVDDEILGEGGPGPVTQRLMRAFAEL